MTPLRQAYFALIFVCIAWGTTYLGIRKGIEYFPPFAFAGIRQVASGIIMLIMALAWFKKADLRLKNILFQALIGFLMISVGNGLVTWGEQFVSSGLAAIICSFMPLMAVGIQLGLKKNERPNASIVIGMLIALVGVYFIVKDHLGSMGDQLFIKGALLILVATFTWALGSVLSKKSTSTVNPFFNAGTQVLSGGIFLMVFSFLNQESYNLSVVPAIGWWVMIYMIIIGSILAYTAYMFMLRILPVGLATIYAYVNPLVAVLIGWWLAGESLTHWTFLALSFIIGGVFMVNRGYRRQKLALIKKDIVLNAE